MSSDPFLDDRSEGEGESDAIALPGFLRDPMGVLRRRWIWMLLVVIAGLSLSGFYLARRIPTYDARATVLVASQRISEQFVQSTVETDQLEKVSAILGELLSRRNLARLVETHELFPPTADGRELTMEQKVAIMRAGVAIGPDRSSSANQSQNSSATVFEVRFTSDDPDKAAAVANDLASGFTDIHLRMRSRQARLTTEFLRRELSQTEEELTAQERRITSFKQAHRGELPSELGTNMSRLDRLQSQRQSLALQIASAESRLATLASTGTDVAPNSAEATLRALRLRYQEQRSLYTADHPNIVSLQNQIAALEEEIAANDSDEVATSAPAEAVQLELRELRRQLAETVAEFDALDRRVAMVPQRQEQLAAMEQRAVILRESHREFLRKVNQAELAEAVESAQQGERATVLDAAVPPREPTSSPMKMIFVLIVGTFGAAVMLAVALELLDAVIVSEAEVEDRYRLPVLGSIPRIS